MEVFFRLDTICSGRDVALIGSSQHTMGSNNFVHISMALFVHESLRNIEAIILQKTFVKTQGQWLWVLVWSLSTVQFLSGPCMVLFSVLVRSLVQSLVCFLSGPCPVLVWSLPGPRPVLVRSWSITTGLYNIGGPGPLQS